MCYLSYRAAVVILIILCCATVNFAQQDNLGARNPELDAWKYVSMDLETQAARQAESRARTALNALIPLERDRIKQQDFVIERVTVALEMATYHLDRAKNYPNWKEAVIEIENYRKLIDFAHLTVSSILENRFNKREHRMLCKEFETLLREQVEVLEEIYHRASAEQSAAVAPILLSTRRYRVELLNRVLGSPLLVPPQQIDTAPAE